MTNIRFESGAVGAGDTSRRGSGSNKMMELRLRNTANKYKLQFKIIF
jgi:hypothetical protein